MAKIKIAGDKIVYDGRYIQTVRRQYQGTRGRKGAWEMIERKTEKRIVAVAALTPRGEILLLKIYRIPLKTYVLELCVGLKNRKETDEAAARRELLEETGCRVKKLEKLVVGPTNPGLVNDDIVFYLGTGAVKVAKPETENGEDIAVFKVPLSRVLKFLSRPPRGTVVDIKIYIALFFLARKGHAIG